MSSQCNLHFSPNKMRDDIREIGDVWDAKLEFQTLGEFI
jgi:hypothetical protein